jgi:GDPmannose 4,6-dehydratase
VHNLAALSSVGLSWKDPDTTRAINQDAVLGMLDVLLEQGDEAPAFVQASSAEIFGPVGDGARVDEQTPLNPTSPYAEAKAGAHLAVISARDAGLRASNLVLFGHTSVLHAPTFALPSITRQAAEVALGVRDAVELANPSTTRDWGAADDFVRAFALVAEGRGDDFVVATGVLHQLREVAGWALASGGPGRPHDFGGLRGDPAKAAQLLGWRPTITLRAQIERMTAVEMRRQTTGIQHDPSYLGTVGSA